MTSLRFAAANATRSLVAVCVLPISANATTTSPSLAPLTTPRSELVAYDGQRLTGELHLGSLHVPPGITLYADEGVRLFCASRIDIEGTLISTRAPLSKTPSADIVLVAGEQIAVHASGLVIGADGRAGEHDVAEPGASVLLLAPLSTIDGVVHAGNGGALGRATRGGDGGAVIVFGAGRTNRRADVEFPGTSPGFGLFGGDGGFGGGNGGHAVVLDGDPHRADAYGIDLHLDAWLANGLRWPAHEQVVKPTSTRVRGFAFDAWAGDGDDEVQCPDGNPGATGAPATGGAGAAGAAGLNAPAGSGLNGTNGGNGGVGGFAQGGGGGNGGGGASCCPAPGGRGGSGGQGGTGTGGRGGSGGSGGNGDGAGLGGCGGNGGNGGDGKGGTGGDGGPGGADKGLGGWWGSGGVGVGGTKGAKGPNGGPVNPACTPVNGTAGNGFGGAGGSWGAIGPGC